MLSPVPAQTASGLLLKVVNKWDLQSSFGGVLPSWDAGGGRGGGYPQSQPGTWGQKQGGSALVASHDINGKTFTEASSARKIRL